MSKIKKFLDFITGYTGFSNKLNRMVNRERTPDVGNIPTTITPEQILELYSMIKDYVSPVGDINGVTITWQQSRVERGVVNMLAFDGHYSPIYKITGLDSFIVYANLKVKSSVNMSDLELELNSAKSQLASEDFILGYEKVDMRKYRDIRDAEWVLTIKHKSYKPPVQKRMRRVA